MRQHGLIVTVVLGLAVLAGCASSGRVRLDAGDQMDEGYRAARRGYWQEALMRYQLANELKPGKVEILNNLAVSLEAVGRYDEAYEVYEEARRIGGGDRKLRRNFTLFKEFYETYVAPEVAEVAAEQASGREDGDE